MLGQYFIVNRNRIVLGCNRISTDVVGSGGSGEGYGGLGEGEGWKGEGKPPYQFTPPILLATQHL